MVQTLLLPPLLQAVIIFSLKTIALKFASEKSIHNSNIEENQLTYCAWAIMMATSY
jgi:hypothetical protein